MKRLPHGQSLIAKVAARWRKQYPFPNRYAGYSVRVETSPEERYQNVLAWVRSQIVRNDVAQDAATSHA